MLASLLSFNAFAVPESNESGTTGECSWSFSTDNNTLTISGKGRMADFGFIDKLPWADCDIEKVVIENGVQTKSCLFC